MSCPVVGFKPCIEDDCRWWEKEGRRCAILSIANDLFRIAEVLDNPVYEDYNPWHEHRSHEPIK